MFKCQEGYTLRKIKGVSYILPFGQQIADQRKGTILNETSAFLWNVIQHNEGADLEMLTEMLARRYGLAEEDFPMLREDILDFLRQLQSMGMLTETLRLQSEEASLCILPIHFPAPIILFIFCFCVFCGASQLFSGYFDKFREMNPAKDADQEIEFFTTPPASKSYGKVLLRNSDMTILENPDRYAQL